MPRGLCEQLLQCTMVILLTRDVPMTATGQCCRAPFQTHESRCQESLHLHVLKRFSRVGQDVAPCHSGGWPAGRRGAEPSGATRGLKGDPGSVQQKAQPRAGLFVGAHDRYGANFVKLAIDGSWPAAVDHERLLRRSETRKSRAEPRAALGKPDGRLGVGCACSPP